MAKWQINERVGLEKFPTDQGALYLEGGLWFNPVGNDLDQYQKSCLETVLFSKDVALSYLSLNLASEAGEVAGKVAKNLRDGGQLDDIALALELSDCLWHVAVLAEHLGYDLSEIADMNIKKLKDRKERGVLGGSGDTR